MSGCLVGLEATGRERGGQRRTGATEGGGVKGRGAIATTVATTAGHHDTPARTGPDAVQTAGNAATHAKNDGRVPVDHVCAAASGTPRAAIGMSGTTGLEGAGDSGVRTIVRLAHADLTCPSRSSRNTSRHAIWTRRHDASCSR